MFPVKVGSTFAVTRWKATVVLLSLGFALFSAQPGQAQPEPLTFFKNYFITGDYAVGGASLWQKGSVDGNASVQIAVTGVPKGADILAAYLYVQTAETDRWSGIDHATFNGYDLGPGSSSLAKALNWELATTPCWTVAYPGGRRLVTYRADVLRFLPVGIEDGPQKGKQLASGPHTLEVPDSGTAFGDVNEGGTESGGGSGPRAIGASLVVVYRDSAMPFKAIVIYDGGFKKTAFATMNQTIAGFYQASASPTEPAKMTHIVGDGRQGVSERVFLDGQLFTNPFVGAEGPKWDNPTFPLTSIPPPLDPGDASVVVKVAPNGLLSDCLCYSGIVLSTQVQDSDGDGLLDIWETSPSLVDPNGQPLPNLAAMGADPTQKDLFIEIGYMQTDAETSYGDVPKPAHSHLPTHAALKLVGDAFANAPTGRINVHFDAGNAYPSGGADPYIIRDQVQGQGLARGGEAIDEMDTVCPPGGTDQPWVCQFSEYPGTVGWKTGFKFLRDQVLIGEPAPQPGEEDLCDLPGSACVRRFDRNRKDMFRYALFAHALGLPKSEEPTDPGFHEPRTNTGVGDFPGGDVMVTLGAFSDTDGLPVGTPFMQASTLMHELGHNMERRHGGGALEPNCKPTYLSVMNYLYQLRGLLDKDGKPHLDFSGEILSPINETLLADGFVSGTSKGYRMGWYAPLSGSYLDGRGKAALRHCDGSPLSDAEEADRAAGRGMVRIDARTAAGGTDWKANGIPDPDGLPPVSPLDINFNGRFDGSDVSPTPLNGSDDWSNILLNQIGARRNTGGVYADFEGYLFVGPLSLDSGRGDLGRGDLGRGDLGRGDLGRGDLGRGDLGRGDLGRGDLGRGDLGSQGRGDLGRGDLGGGDLFVGDPDSPGGELDFETATELAKTPPNEFTACVIGVDCPSSGTPLHAVSLGWTAPNVGGAVRYTIYRVAGETLVPDTPLTPWTSVGQVNAAPGQVAYSLVDSSPLSNAAQYTYFAVATYEDEIQSDPSNLVTIIAVNAPPVGVAQNVTTLEDTPKAITLAGSDVDGGEVTSYDVTTWPTHGTLSGTVPNLTYTPDPNYNGSDSFEFAVSDGPATGAAATVSITVTPVNDAPVAANDLVTVAEDSGPTAILVLANDTDVDGTLTAVLITGPSHGTVLLNSDGSFSYTPAANYSGSDSFIYRASDGLLDSSPATVSIVVTPVNDAPVAGNDGYSTAEDTPLNQGAPGVLGNDTDIDSTLTAVLVTAPSHGTLALNANGSFTYTPALNYNGPDAFTYKAYDGTAYTDTATVSITIASVNDAPTTSNIADRSINANGNTGAVSFTIGDDDLATVAVSGSSSNTTLVPNANIVFGGSGADRTVTVTPAADQSGKATITVTVTDGVGVTASDTFVLTVKAVGYSLLNVKNLPPAAGVTFKPSSSGTLVDLEWKFTTNGAVVNSADAQPIVTITGPGGYWKTLSGGGGNDCSNFEYKTRDNKWDVHWQPKNAAVGTYYVVVTSQKTGQRFPETGPGFPVVFKK